MSWGMPLLAALLIGLTLGLFGSGGSILTVPVLIFLLDMPEKLAISTALGIVALISLGAVTPYLWRRQVAGKLLAQLALPGIMGAAAGGYASQWLPALLQLIVLCDPDARCQPEYVAQPTAAGAVATAVAGDAGRDCFRLDHRSDWRWRRFFAGAIVVSDQ